MIETLAGMFRAAKRAVAFTGAGISADSGIPTYRGAEGVWNKYDPARYANIDSFRADPAYYWSFFRDVRFPSLKDARPNRAHEVLAGLEKQGRLRAVITQNIDGLHQMAGSRRVLELHGSTRRIVCQGCGAAHTMDDVFEQLNVSLPPRCGACGGPLRPCVVFFGEALPQDVLGAAVEEARNCDLFLAIGSSLLVQPAATLPTLAKDSGALLVIINKDATPLDATADLVFRDGASDVLGAIAPV